MQINLIIMEHIIIIMVMIMFIIKFILLVEL